jgi:hypothetical protein
VLSARIPDTAGGGNRHSGASGMSYILTDALIASANDHLETKVEARIIGTTQRERDRDGDGKRARVARRTICAKHGVEPR